MWELVDDGKTISDVGCDGGIILKDEEMTGARITLEEGSIIAKFSITCGIYGLMVHTVCAGTENEALLMYDKMKEEIEWFMKQDFDDEQNIEWCEAFVNKY